MAGLLALSPPLCADEVEVVSIQGQVLYGAGNATPSSPIKAGDRVGAGTFSASGNGIAFLSTFSGSELRLAESGTLRFYGTDESCDSAHGTGHRSSFRLIEGKLRVTIRVPGQVHHCYHIDVDRGGATVESGQCVLCMHGHGAFIYVARGRTEVTEEGPSETDSARVLPRFAATSTAESDRNRSKVLTADGTVGVIDGNGVTQVEALSSVSPGTQNCLLAGLGSEPGSGGAHPHLDATIVVSPTQ